MAAWVVVAAVTFRHAVAPDVDINAQGIGRHVNRVENAATEGGETEW